MTDFERRDVLGLDGAVAIVNGAGAGLGKATALLLAESGCHVAAVDIDADAAARVAAAVEALGRRAIALEADTTNGDDVERVVEEAASVLGPADVVVNVVGGVGIAPKPFVDMTREEWEIPFTRNVASTYLCTRAAALMMVKHNVPGRIVNFASSSGVVGAPNIAPYGAANAAVIHFTKSAAMELAPFGLRVNCVVPGTHWTERSRANFADPDTPPEAREFTRLANDAPPLKRLGEASETAGVALFLASDLSAYMTGHAVLSDGGVTHTTARPPVGLNMVPSAFAGFGVKPGTRHATNAHSQQGGGHNDAGTRLAR